MSYLVVESEYQSTVDYEAKMIPVPDEKWLQSDHSFKVSQYCWEHLNLQKHLTISGVDMSVSWAYICKFCVITDKP